MKSMAAILVIDDQIEHLQAVQMLLEAEGYRVTLCTSASEALTILETEPINLILADVAMPQMNGYQLLEAIRRRVEWTGIPLVYLTGRALDSDIRFGKALGADDYLTKPIQPEDLLAVVEGKLRRYAQLLQRTPVAQPAVAEQLLYLGPLQIDPERHRAWVHEEELMLSAREFTLLTCLMRQAGRIMSARELVRITHNLDLDDTDEARELVRPLVRTLRQKLNLPLGQPGSIETVRGLGYRMLEVPPL
ncbi:response regulator transcription factor [Candidatus Chloroploca sp. M-50]|uniref:Response regulator transcription factor n=1 Tax=Candidatus Chloroploca mongolica TaxID=2528176 RepID=A0ABS4DGV0_9CHLR|nr:response regulator transcription factor [Candidatus Chloroploca mongolica]MBP1468671.1 response regulator transcription factor [Candidatus Chloroploca mongolica]